MILSIAMMLFQGATFTNAIPAAVARPVAASVTAAAIPGLLSSLPDTSSILIQKSSNANPVPVPSPAEEPKTETVVSTSTSGGIAPHLLSADALGSGSEMHALSLIRIAPSASKSRFVSVHQDPSRRAWIALAIAAHSAAAFDAYSTRESLAHGNVERDPLLRPFASSPAIYAAIQAGPVMFDYMARKMQRSQINFLRRTWWIPQTASAVMSLSYGIHNMRLANRP